MLRYIVNSLRNTVLSVGLIIIMAFTAAYVLSRYKFKGRNFIYNYFIIGMLIPIHALLVPMYVQFKQAGLTNHWYTLLLPYIAFGLPISIMLIESYISAVPKELEEAAAIDGATGKEAFMKITLPLMKPVIQVNVTMAVISALKQMETVYLLTNGGPGDQTQFMANYLYKQAFNSFKYGYGNTISVAFIMICLLATVLLNRIFKEKDA